MRNFLSLGSFAAALALSVGAAAIPAPAQAQTRVAAGQDISDFYRARDGRPLWFGQPGQQAEMLVRLFASANVDGLDPSRYPVEALNRAIADARSGNRKAMRRAYFPEARGYADTPVYDRYELAAGTILTGPAIVEERESTTVLPPGVTATVDEYANLIAETRRA